MSPSIKSILAAVCLLVGSVPDIGAQDTDELTNQYSQLYQQGDYQEAAAIAEKVVALLKKEAQQRPGAYAVSLNNLASLYQSMGAYEKAKPLLLEATGIWARVLGEEDPVYASSLNNLAGLYESMAAYETAEPLYLEAIGIQARALGKEHPDYATSLNNLALLYESMAAYEKAEPLYLEAKEIRARSLGEEHPDYSTSLNNLAGMYFRMGAYEKAEPLFLRAEEIEARLLGKEHPAYVTTLNNLAVLYESMGAYEKAERLFLQAEELKARVLGEEHPAYATTLDNLAGLYFQMGAYEKAEPLFLHAEKIRARVLGEEHPDYAATLNNLAGLYRKMGVHEKAERLYLRTKEIEARVLGEEHPAYAITLDNLAGLYASVGAYEKAEPLYLQAKKIRARVLGEEHPAYATTLNNLAELYAAMEAYEKAEPLYLQAIEIWVRVLGEDHPSYAATLNNLARLYHAMGKHARAEQVARETLETERRLLARVFSAFPEKDREFFLRTLGTWELPCILENGPLAADAALAFKGAIAASLLEERRLLGAALDPAAEVLVNRLQVLRRQFHRATLQGYQERVKADALFAEIENVERQFAQYVSGLGVARRSLLVETDTVRRALPPQTALVEYLRFWRPVVGNEIPKEKRWEDRYGAVVILPATELGQPVFVDLGSAGEINAAVEQFRSLVSIQPKGEREIIEATRQLYQLLLAPLEPALAVANTLVLSPDSQLHFLCFEPLLDASDRMACEKWNIRMSDTGRDLLEQTEKTVEKATQALLLGDAAFDSEGDTPEGNAESSDRRGLLDLEKNLALGMRQDVAEVSFGPLPGTRQEVAELEAELGAAGWNTLTFSGQEASETMMRAQVKGRRLIHLATHGFFLNELKVGRDEPNLSRGIEGAWRKSEALQDSMVRSGLALTGANRTLESWQGGTVPDPSNDGILTASEAVTLNLAGTELIVLSACETARGTALDGEGIYGLRRALKLAGTDSVVMTLWPIADEYTVGFMKDFYARYLDGQHPAMALAETKKEHLVKLRAEFGLLTAIQLVGPFIATGKGGAAVGAKEVVGMGEKSRR